MSKTTWIFLAVIACVCVIAQVVDIPQSGSTANWTASGTTDSTLPGTASTANLRTTNGITLGIGTRGVLTLDNSLNETNTSTAASIVHDLSSATVPTLKIKAADGTTIEMTPLGGGGNTTKLISSVAGIRLYNSSAFIEFLTRSLLPGGTGSDSFSLGGNSTDGGWDSFYIDNAGHAYLYGSGLGLTNYERADFQFAASTGLTIDLQAGGSGTYRPMYFKIGGTNNFQIVPGSGIQSTYATGTYTTTNVTVTCDIFRTVQHHSLILSNNLTLVFSGVVNGMEGTMIVQQNSAGSKTITLPASSKVISGGSGAVTLTTTANAYDILTWTYDGTSYFWNIGKNYN